MRYARNKVIPLGHARRCFQCGGTYGPSRPKSYSKDGLTLIGGVLGSRCRCGAEYTTIRNVAEVLAKSDGHDTVTLRWSGVWHWNRV